jgi:zinc D-Ala-D-Ala dipeptidase
LKNPPLTAAEALVRVNAALKPKGYGLLIFDGYRPRSVTKIFWDMASEEECKNEFVANPKRVHGTTARAPWI